MYKKGRSAAGLTKKQIRSKMLLRLKTQKEEDQDQKSRIIQEKLFRTKVFQKAKRVMFYVSMAGEVDTRKMIKAAQKKGKIVAVPVCKKNKVVIRPCILKDKTRLVKGPYGVCEPLKKKFINASNINLVIVPGLAFDKQGNRLGRGKGCYDYFLKRMPKRIPSIGLAFGFQILPQIPAGTSDVKVHRVIFS